MAQNPIAQPLKKAFGKTLQIKWPAAPVDRVVNSQQVDDILALAGVIEEAITRLEGEYKILQAAADDFKAKHITPLTEELDAIKDQVKEALVKSNDHTNYDMLHGKTQLTSRLEPVVKDEPVAIDTMKRIGLYQFVKESLKVGDLKKNIKLTEEGVPKLYFQNADGLIGELDMLKCGFEMKDVTPFTFKPKFDKSLLED